MKYDDKDIEELIAHAKNVGSMASSLMSEIGPRPKGVTDWMSVNDTLCGISKALKKLGHVENK